MQAVLSEAEVALSGRHFGELLPFFFGANGGILSHFGSRL